MRGDSRSADARHLAVGAVRATALLSAPVTLVAGLLAGPWGALSAVTGLAMVLLLFGSSALLLARVVTGDAGHGLGIMLVGAGIRVVLYLGVLTLLDELAWVHGRSLAAATGLAVAVTLTHELRLLARAPRLFWIDPDAGRRTAVPHATRSESL